MGYMPNNMFPFLYSFYKGKGHKFQSQNCKIPRIIRENIHTIGFGSEFLDYDNKNMGRKKKNLTSPKLNHKMEENVCKSYIW